MEESVELFSLGFGFEVEIKKQGSKYSSFELISNGAKGEGFDKVNYENLFIIDSVNSGVGRSPLNDFYNNVMKPVLLDLSVDYTYIRTESKDSTRVLASNLDTSKNYTFVFLSGDTSISEFVNNLPQDGVCLNKKSVNILPIPLGTGNAWASSLQLVSPQIAFKRFLKNELTAKSFPLYSATFPNKQQTLFFIILSMGFHANLLHACESEEYQKMGNERFLKASQNIFKNYDLDLDISVTTQSKEIRRNYAYFAIINTPNLELTYIPSPKSNVFKSELHLLGYDSKLPSDDLVKKIMAGYSYKINDELQNDDKLTYYHSIDSLEDGFEISLNTSADNVLPHYKYEICCDGLLMNLDEMNNEVGGQAENKNKIKIQSAPANSQFNLHVLA